MLKITKEEIRCIWPSEDFVVIKVPRSRLTNIFLLAVAGLISQKDLTVSNAALPGLPST